MIENENGEWEKKEKEKERKIQVFDSFDTIARQRIRKNRNIVDETKNRMKKNVEKIKSKSIIESSQKIYL